MKRESLLIKIIIYLFEKYAMDEWIERANKEERQRVKDKYNLQTEEEIDEAILEQSQSYARESYYEGRKDGYEEAMEEL